MSGLPVSAPHLRQAAPAAGRQALIFVDLRPVTHFYLLSINSDPTRPGPQHVQLWQLV